MIDASEIGRKLQKQFWLANASESRKQLLRWETELSISRFASIYACVGRRTAPGPPSLGMAPLDSFSVVWSVAAERSLPPYEYNFRQ